MSYTVWLMTIILLSGYLIFLGFSKTYPPASSVILSIGILIYTIIAIAVERYTK